MSEQGDFGTKLEFPRASSAKAELVLGLAERYVLYKQFVSLGNNCEFGIVQRSNHYNQANLFNNVGFRSIDAILIALESSFYGMFDDNYYKFKLPSDWPDWQIECEIYGFTFHTGIPAGIERNSLVLDRETKRAVQTYRYLKKLMLEILASGEKTFVFRMIENPGDALVSRLSAAIRRHGPGWLLHVQQDALATRGNTVQVGDNIIRASLPKLSHSDPPVIDFDGWDMVALRSLQIRYAATRSVRSTPGGIVSAPRVQAKLDHPYPKIEMSDRESIPNHSAQTSVNRVGSLKAYRVPWMTGTSATAEISSEIPVLIDGYEIIKHVLTADTDDSSGLVLSCAVHSIVPGCYYVLSVWLWIPDQYKGSICAVFPGSPSVKLLSADMGRRNRWQRVATSFRSNPAETHHHPGILAKGEAGGHFYSTRWRFELGIAPSDDFPN